MKFLLSNKFPFCVVVSYYIYYIYYSYLLKFCICQPMQLISAIVFIIYCDCRNVTEVSLVLVDSLDITGFTSSKMWQDCSNYSGFISGFFRLNLNAPTVCYNNTSTVNVLITPLTFKPPILINPHSLRLKFNKLMSLMPPPL